MSTIIPEEEKKRKVYDYNVYKPFAPKTPTYNFNQNKVTEPKTETAPVPTQFVDSWGGAYTEVRNKMKTAKDKYAKSRTAYADAQANRLNSQKHAVNQNYESNVKEANRMQDASLRSLPSDLAGLGLYGQGVGETAVANIKSNYSKQIGELMRKRDADLYNIDSEVENIRAQAEADILAYNTQLLEQDADLYLQMLQQQKNEDKYNREYADKRKDVAFEQDATIRNEARLEDQTAYNRGRDTISDAQGRVNTAMTYGYAPNDEDLAIIGAGTSADIYKSIAGDIKADKDRAITDTARKEAEATVYNLVDNGELPDDAMLEQAGLLGQKAQLQGIANRNKETHNANIYKAYKNGSGGSGSGGGSGKEQLKHRIDQVLSSYLYSPENWDGTGYFDEASSNPDTYNQLYVVVRKLNKEGDKIRDELIANGYTDVQATSKIKEYKTNTVKKIAKVENETEEAVRKKLGW